MSGVGKLQPQVTRVVCLGKNSGGHSPQHLLPGVFLPQKSYTVSKKSDRRYKFKSRCFCSLLIPNHRHGIAHPLGSFQRNPHRHATRVFTSRPQSDSIPNHELATPSELLPRFSLEGNRFGLDRKINRAFARSHDINRFRPSTCVAEILYSCVRAGYEGYEERRQQLRVSDLNS